LHAHPRWRNANKPAPGCAGPQCRERARVRRERHAGEVALGPGL